METQAKYLFTNPPTINYNAFILADIHTFLDSIIDSQLKNIVFFNY